MVMLFLCVLCSVAVSVLFKWARPRGLQAAQAVAVNYLVAILAAYALLQPDVNVASVSQLPWVWVGLAGVLLPLVFVVMAHAVYQVGIVRADVAQRLSLVIPLLASALIFGEVINGVKTMGLILALLAVVALIWPKNKMHSHELTHSGGLMLFLVWLGYGVMDIIFKQIAKTGTQFSLVLLVSFTVAAVLIWLYLCLGKTMWHAFSLRCGVLLGGLNFGNIYFYVKSHQTLHATPSLVFAGVNVGVLSVAMLVGSLVYKERLSHINLAGVLLALLAMACLALSLV